ncbi:hypothetical protein GGI04_003347 [Coemansia thaxteri]|nr:hypothetical protein GGI04_003347 [Coemansia thaxteri]
MDFRATSQSILPAEDDGAVLHALDSMDHEPPCKRFRAQTTSDDDDDDDDDDMFESVPHIPAAYIDELSDDLLPELGTIELTVGDDSAEALATKPRRMQVTLRARAARRYHHMAYLLCHTASARLLNHVCTKPLILARCLSLLPPFVINRISEHLVPGKLEIRCEWAPSDLHYFLSWYRSQRTRVRKPRTSAGLENDFLQFVETRKARWPWHQPMLLVCMLRALAFDVRLCVGIAPPPLKLTLNECVDIELSLGHDPGATHSTHSAGQARQKQHTQSQLDKENHSLVRGVPEFWCEVLDLAAESWVPINAYTGTIEHATSLVQPQKRQHCVFPYIIGLDLNNHIYDITRRYAQDFTNTTRQRRLESVDSKVDKGAHLWWERWISRWAGSIDARDKNECKSTRMEEEAASSAMPKRIADFAKNPFYVLKRNLRQNEIIYPDRPVVGKIKGESVYLRENVRVLRTTNAWMREGRQVKPSQVPVKQIKQRAVTARSKIAAEAMEAAGGELVADLYGEWQTELFEPPPVCDGRVPRNDYGNVNLFAASMLPKGAAHVPNPNARRVCKELGVDAADAVVGFEFRRGQSLPVVQGVVIPREAFDLIVDALREDRHNTSEKRLAEIEQRTLKHWHRLLLALRVRADVDASFARRSERSEGMSFSTKGDKKGKQRDLEHSSPNLDERTLEERPDQVQDTEADDTEAGDTGGGFLA